MSRPRSVLANGLAAIALGSSLLAAAPALAAPTWLAPAKLSAAGQTAEKPQVSVDVAGDALTVWERLGVIEASSRPAGSGSWQAPVTLSNTKDQSSLPQVALDSHGDAVVVWLSFDGSEYSIETAIRSGLSGSWQAPVTLRTLGAMTVAEPRPDLAVDAQGDAVAIWQRLHGAEAIVEASSRPAASGSWTTPETLSEEGENLHPAEVAIDAKGNATAVWEEKETGEVAIDAAVRPASGKWEALVTLSAIGANANEPRLAVGAQGEAVAVWERFEGEELIEAASRASSGAAWGKAVALTKPEGGKGEPAGQQVAVDGQGDAVVVWSRTNASHDVVEATEGRTSSSVWQPPVSLSPAGGMVEEQPRVAVNGHGSAVVVWERSNGSNEVIEAASGLAASGSWRPPVSLSAAGEEAAEPEAALDEQGNAAAVWRRFDGKTSYIAEAAALDAAGPLLSSLAIPTAGTTGQALAFSVSPFDVWSALAATNWSFGDGTNQVGTSVGHAYGAPGTYTVTVTGADVLGNATNASAAVSIAASPAASAKVGSPVAPAITGARLVPPRFRVSKRATAISARPNVPQGTSFHFTLSEAARLQIAFKHSVAGLRSGRRCVAPSAKLRRRHAKRCTRTLIVGQLSRSQEQKGADTLAFSGRIGTRALAPGAYTATLTAITGGLTSVPVTLSLTVVR